MTRLFSVYGDSISSFEGILPQGWRVFFEGEQLELTGVKTPHDTWWGQVIDHFDGQFLANASWSGCVVEGRDFPVGASAERIEHLQADGRTPDDILVHIGINDYGWGSGYAQICAATPSAPPKLAAECPDHGKVAGMAPEGTLANFEESYRRMLASASTSTTRSSALPPATPTAAISWTCRRSATTTTPSTEPTPPRWA